MAEEEKDPTVEEDISKFTEWLKADWSHIVLIMIGVLLIIMVIAYATKR